MVDWINALHFAFHCFGCTEKMWNIRKQPTNMRSQFNWLSENGRPLPSIHFILLLLFFSTNRMRCNEILFNFFVINQSVNAKCVFKHSISLWTNICFNAFTVCVLVVQRTYKQITSVYRHQHDKMCTYLISYRRIIIINTAQVHNTRMAEPDNEMKKKKQQQEGKVNKWTNEQTYKFFSVFFSNSEKKIDSKTSYCRTVGSYTYVFGICDNIKKVGCACSCDGATTMLTTTVDSECRSILSCSLCVCVCAVWHIVKIVTSADDTPLNRHG